MYGGSEKGTKAVEDMVAWSGRSSRIVERGLFVERQGSSVYSLHVDGVVGI
jgi:hypothetical protein